MPFPAPGFFVRGSQYKNRAVHDTACNQQKSCLIDKTAFYRSFKVQIVFFNVDKHGSGQVDETDTFSLRTRKDHI